MSDAGCRYSRDLIILPSMCNADSLLSIPAAFDKRVGPAVAKAVSEAAKASGVARI